MVGAALIRRLAQDAPRDILNPSRKTLDLRDQSQTQEWLKTHSPDVIFMAAAKVGGIQANQTYPADFLYENLMIAANVIDGAQKSGVEKLLYLGSSCIYPKLAEQPISEAALMTGALEPTNAPYAIAKISGIHLCQTYAQQYGCNFISAMPTNLYGPGDNYHAQNAHVIPALIRRAHMAKTAGETTLKIWGTGTPRREFLHADDCADALVHIMKNYVGSESTKTHINVGSGTDIPISTLAQTICDIVGFTGQLTYDASKPDGTPRKLMSGEKLKNLGWQAKINLKTGLENAYSDFCTRFGYI